MSFSFLGQDSSKEHTSQSKPSSPQSFLESNDRSAETRVPGAASKEKRRSSLLLGKLGGHFLNKQRSGLIDESGRNAGGSTLPQAEGSEREGALGNEAEPAASLEASENETVHEETVYVQELARNSRHLPPASCHIEFPQIQLAPWGVRWSKDIIVLLQNAVLAEIRDLFSFGAVMQNRKFVLTRKHLDTFYVWFDVFHEFVENCLRAEEDYLIPWIAGNHFLPGAPGRLLFYGTFRRILQLISEYRTKFLKELPAGERLHGLLVLIAKLSFVPRDQSVTQATLPAYIERHHLHTPWQKSSALRGVILFMRNLPMKETNLVLMSRWLPWDGKYFLASVLRPIDMMRIGTWRRNVLKEHTSKNFDSEIVADDVASSSDQDQGRGIALAIRYRDELEKTRGSARFDSSLVLKETRAYWPSEGMQSALIPDLQEEKSVDSDTEPLTVPAPGAF